METRAITIQEVEAFRREIFRTFGVDGEDDAEAASRFMRILPLARTYAVFEGGDIVATSGTFEFDLTVPGGSLPMAGLTMVTVRPTHRRRGLLRRMMRAYMDDLTEHEEPLGGLWASETSIYGRFGFGIAAEGDDMDLDTSTMRFEWPAALDDVAMLETEDALEVLPDVYDRVRDERPGMFSRSDAWWQERRIYDPKSRRQGASEKRRAVCKRGGAVTGYVEYRHRNKWKDGMPHGTVELVELIATDARAEASLWRFVTNIDMYPCISWWNAPVDSPLTWMTHDRRHVRSHRKDSLWLRICRVPAALSARRYAADGSLRMAVTDEEGATVTYELMVEGGAASCTRSTAKPDVALGLSTLGCVYLGGVSPLVLARAGRIEASDSAVLRMQSMFGAEQAPWCPEVF